MPISILLAGPTGVGKTTFVSQPLRQRAEVLR
jgi:GTPase SAR1 family protein